MFWIVDEKKKKNQFSQNFQGRKLFPQFGGPAIPNMVTPLVEWQTQESNYKSLEIYVIWPGVFMYLKVS